MELAGLGAFVAALVAVPLALLPILNSIRADRSKWRQLERLAGVAEKVPVGSPLEGELRAFELQLVRDLRDEYNRTPEERRLRRDGVETVVALVVLILVGATALAIGPIPAWLVRILVVITGGAVGILLSNGAFFVRRRWRAWRKTTEP